MTGPDNDVRFLVDLNVGRLAKWLRALGYDTLFLPDHDDHRLVQHAMREHRVLLTKDTRILQRRVAAQGKLKALLIAGDRHWDQLRYVVTSLGLHPQEAAMFTLCLECNELLEPRSKEQVREQVPAFVFKTQESFHQCPTCRRIYWRGTHWSNMRMELQRVLQAGA
jgi:uncharacterized protein with PIN domain